MAGIPKGMKRMNLNVPEKLHNAFKAACASRGEGMTDELLAFIRDYVRQHLPPSMRRGGRK
jgi:hypothetical protein